MNKSTLIVFLLVIAAVSAALATGTPPVSAQFQNYGDMQVYVRNKPLNSAQFYSGEAYAPVGDFLRALKFSATQGDDGVVHITSDPGTVDTIQPKGGLTFEYNGTTFTVPYKAGAAVTVELRRMSANLGASYIVSKETGIIDVIVPQGMSAKQYQTEHNTARMKGDRAGSSAGPSTFGPSQSGDVDRTASSTADMLKKPVDGAGPTADQTKAGMGQGPVDSAKNATAGSPTTTPGTGGTTPAAGAAQAEESPIKQVGDIGGFSDDKTGQCWWNVTIKNTGDQVVNNVILTLHIADVAGKDYDTQIKPVGNMNPGDQSKLEFYWQGMRKLIITPKVEIKHDPLPKKEEKPAATPQKQLPSKQPVTK